MAVRKRTSAMTPAERSRFINVITQLINAAGDPNPYGIMVGYHSDMSHRMHGAMGNMVDPVGRQRFLPWHRVYLLKLEQMGQAIDPLFFIPYWDWTAQREVPTWLVGFTPTIKVAGPNVTVVRFPRAGSQLPTQAQINAIRNRPTYTQFTRALEEGPHNFVHGWFSQTPTQIGTMSLINVSPADPIFWMHHAMIDKVWAAWQTTHPGLEPSLSGANRIMDPWTETAAQVRSITTLGYSYGP